MALLVFTTCFKSKLASITNVNAASKATMKRYTRIYIAKTYHWGYEEFEHIHDIEWKEDEEEQAEEIELKQEEKEITEQINETDLEE